MNRNISGYCNCFSENRDITVEYLPVAVGRSMNNHYKKGLTETALRIFAVVIAQFFPGQLEL